MTTPSIIVGLSGGVDSSVSALLLQEQGYAVAGLFMKNWEEDDTDTYCSAAIDRADAAAVCDKLGIELHTINFAAEYWDHVFEYFLKEYAAGNTPNPDILCNKEIKFRYFLDYVQVLGAHTMATGHYAQLRERDGLYQLCRGRDPNKDQTYFLYALNQQQLSASCFPVGHLLKSEVRQLAKKAQLPTHAKKDSTGICFIGEKRFKTFLERYLPAKPGLIQTEKGVILGEHSGLMYYTLGQRQGLGIGGRRHAAEAPWYVIHKDLENNLLIVAQGHEHPSLYQDELITRIPHWIAGAPPRFPLHCTAKIRYRHQDAVCRVELETADALRVYFEQAQWAITPGQSVVFYQDDVCLGGAVIA